MALYLDRLAPYERKSEYLQNIQFRGDVRGSLESINQSIKASAKRELELAHRSVVSQERIAEGLGSLTDHVRSINAGIHDLGASFEWGLSEIAWQLEQSNGYLQAILESVQAPRGTEADERIKRARRAFANQWYDDAEQEFLAAEELNKFDFTIYIGLGIIYLFHLIDKYKALEYFQKAMKYAAPESPYYASFAAMHAGLIMRDLGRIDDARGYASQALDLYPGMLAARYNFAQYNAMLGNDDQALAELKRLIQSDRMYAKNCMAEEAFGNIRDRIIDLLKDMGDQQVRANQRLLGEAEAAAKVFANWIDQLGARGISKGAVSNDLGSMIERYRVLVGRGSYLEIMEATDLLNTAVETARTTRAKMNSAFDSYIGSFRSEKSTAETRRENARWISVGAVSGVLILAAVIMYIVGLVIEYDNGLFNFILMLVIGGFLLWLYAIIAFAISAPIAALLAHVFLSFQPVYLRRDIAKLEKSQSEMDGFLSESVNRLENLK